MIRLELEINEESKKEYENIEGFILNCDIKEIAVKPTESEIKTSNLFKKRLQVDKKVQFVNNSKNLENLLKSYLEGL